MVTVLGTVDSYCSSASNTINFTKNNKLQQLNDTKIFM